MSTKRRLKKVQLQSFEERELHKKLLEVAEVAEISDDVVIEFAQWLHERAGNQEFSALQLLRERANRAISPYGPYCYWDKKKALDEAIMEILPRADVRRIKDFRRALQDAEDAQAVPLTDGMKHPEGK